MSLGKVKSKGMGDVAGSSCKDIYINFLAVPSLQNMALAKLVFTIWKDPDLIDIIEEYVETEIKDKITFYVSERSLLYVKIVEKVAVLHMPTFLRKTFFNAVMRIGHDLLTFFCVGEGYYPPVYSLLQHCQHFEVGQCIQLLLNDSLCIDMRGFVNELKLLESLVNTYSSKRFLKKAFVTACAYSHYELITKIWALLSDASKKRIVNWDHYDNSDIDSNDLLTAYWTSRLTDEPQKLINFIGEIDSEFLSKGDSVSKYMLKLAIGKGVPVCVKFFWSELTQEEKNSDIVSFIDEARTCMINDEGKSINRIHVLLFLISECKINQVELFRSQPEVLLEALFQCWHFQDYIVPVFKLVQDTLEDQKYVDFMCGIIAEMQFKNIYANFIFRHVWSASSSRSRVYFIDALIADNFKEMQEFLCADDVETPLLILKDVNLEKKKSIFNMTLSNFSLECLMEEDKLHLLEYLIKTVFGSTTILKEYKEMAASKFESILCGNCSETRKAKEVWEMSERLLDWAFDSEEDVQTLKQRVDSVKIAETALKSGNFELFHFFIKWLGLSSPAVESLKRKIQLENIIVGVIKINDYDNIDKFLDWLYGSEEQKWSMMKHVIMNDSRELLKHFSLLDWDEFEIFSSWCFRSSEDLGSFKLHIASKEVITNIIISSLNRMSTDHCVKMMRYADRLLKWSLGAKNEVLNFKNDLFISTFGMKLVKLANSNTFVPSRLYMLVYFFDALKLPMIEGLASAVNIHKEINPICSCEFHDEEAVGAAVRFLKMYARNVY